MFVNVFFSIAIFILESDNLVDVEVEFDYEAELSDELSLKTGDIIENVKRMDGGWWEGSLNGKKGVFPDNFVKVRHILFLIWVLTFSIISYKYFYRIVILLCPVFY